MTKESPGRLWLGTIRASDLEDQIRKEQFRWKMGTVPTCKAAQAAGGEKSTGAGALIGRSAEAADATACRSCAAERSGAGAAGARFSAEAAQQEAEAQLVQPFAQHVTADSLAGPTWAAENAKPWQRSTRPINRTATAFARRADIYLTSRKNHANLTESGIKQDRSKRNLAEFRRVCEERPFAYQLCSREVLGCI
jgi:hypothetical protein